MKTENKNTVVDVDNRCEDAIKRITHEGENELDVQVLCCTAGHPGGNTYTYWHLPACGPVHLSLTVDQGNVANAVMKIGNKQFTLGRLTYGLTGSCVAGVVEVNDHWTDWVKFYFDIPLNPGDQPEEQATFEIKNSARMQGFRRSLPLTDWVDDCFQDTF